MVNRRMVECDCDAHSYCPQGNTGSKRKCSIWVEFKPSVFAPPNEPICSVQGPFAHYIQVGREIIAIENAARVAATIYFLAHGNLSKSTQADADGQRVTQWNTDAQFFDEYRKLGGWIK